jgi:hypothetical protein
MRLDLPPAAHEEQVVGDVADRLLHAGAHEALVLVWTGEPDDRSLGAAGAAAGAVARPRARLVRRLLDRLRMDGIATDAALLVRAGCWASYDCSDERCCPAGGTPLPAPGSSAGLGLVAAETVGRGTVLLPTRDALVSRLLAPAPTEPVLRALEAAGAARRGEQQQGRASAGQRALAAWRAALRAAPGAAPEPAVAVELVVALEDVVVRDEVLSTLLDDPDGLLWVLLALAAATPPPHDVQVCALIGWVAHARGDGALANVAIDRALGTDPACGLARLCRQALERQVTPSELRRLVAESRGVLRATYAWAVP